MKTKNGWTACNRGHKYRGPAPCPICYPASRRKKKA